MRFSILDCNFRKRGVTEQYVESLVDSPLGAKCELKNGSKYVAWVWWWTSTFTIFRSLLIFKLIKFYGISSSQISQTIFLKIEIPFENDVFQPAVTELLSRVDWNIELNRSIGTAKNSGLLTSCLLMLPVRGGSLVNAAGGASRLTLRNLFFHYFDTVKAMEFIWPRIIILNQNGEIFFMNNWLTVRTLVEVLLITLYGFYVDGTHRQPIPCLNDSTVVAVICSVCDE